MLYPNAIGNIIKVKTAQQVITLEIPAGTQQRHSSSKGEELVFKFTIIFEKEKKAHVKLTCRTLHPRFNQTQG